MACQSKLWRRVVSRVSFSEKVFQINFKGSKAVHVHDFERFVSRCITKV